MGRLYLIVIVMLGLASAVFTRLPSHKASSGSDSEQPLRIVELQPSGSASRVMSSSQDGTVELERSSDGHFYADVEINGATVHALVDTGASGIALSREAARSAGLATSIGMNDVVGEGADGAVHGEYVNLERVTLGSKTVENMQAIVLNSGELTLLGQEFLSKFDSVEIRGDVMVLK